MPKGIYTRTNSVWNKGLTKETDKRIARYYSRPRPDISKTMCKRWADNPLITNPMRNPGTVEKVSNSIKALWEQGSKGPYFKPYWHPDNNDIQQIRFLYCEQGKTVKEIAEFLYNGSNESKIYKLLQELNIIRSFSEIVSNYWNKIPKDKRIEMLGDFIDAGHKAMLKQRRPTGPEKELEKLLNSICPNEYRYSGNGIVKIGTLYPDFINTNGKKKVVEVFGDWWHRNANPEDKINQYKSYGFDCLVLWEHELRNRNKDKVAHKIGIFNVDL